MIFTTRQLRSAVLACATGLALSAPPASAQDATETCELCTAGAELITRFQLREARTPVRERADWTPPLKIVLAGGRVSNFAEMLQRVAPNAEVISLQNTESLEAALAGADVYIGQCLRRRVELGVDLKWIHIPSAGIGSCSRFPELIERGVLVTNMQRVYGAQIAEHAIAMMLSLARQLPGYGADQAKAYWTDGSDLDTRLRKTMEIGGKTMLVVGLGGIGTEVAMRASGLGMRVLATRNSRREGPEYVEYVGLAHETLELAARADVVVNAAPLTPDTRDMFDSAFFSAMKETAYFINIARGPSVVTQDLVAALESGAIAGAGLDVTAPEPLPADHPLWSMENVIITPHVAAASDRFMERFAIMLAENLRRYVAGDPMLSVVNLARGY